MLRAILQPAVRLMNRLTATVKPVVLAAVFLIALTVPTYQMIAGLNADIAFFGQEIKGAEYLPRTLSLLQHVQQHRGMAAAVLSGDESFKAAMAQQQDTIEKDIQAIDVVEAKYGTEFGTLERWNEVKAQWASLKNDVLSLSSDESFNRHVNLIDGILDYQAAVADASKLTLDPNQDTYYLIIAVMSDYANATEYMGQARAYGTAAIGNQQIEEQKSTLEPLLVRSQDSISKANEDVEKAMAANPSVRANVEQTYLQTQEKEQKFLATLKEQVLNAPTVTISSADYFDTVTQSIDAQFELMTLLTDNLTRLLENRIQNLATQRIIILSSVLVLAALAAWLFSGFYLASTIQAQESIDTLEQRVAERTQALASVAEISTATSTILETDKLLDQVVELTKERFNLYHSHIYLMDEAGENLVLTAGAGEPGRIMSAEKRSIPLSREQSLVARAAREQKGVTVNDVTQAPDFLPNPLLPDTRSELAVPMIVGDRVLGVFDIQSDQVGRFTDADVNIQTTMASQIAVSVQNARQIEKTIATAAELAGIQSAVSEAAIIATTDVAGKILEVNDNFMRISKYSREELIGQDHRILNSGYHSKEFIRDLWVTIANGRVWRNEIKNKAKDGSYYWVDTTISPILNERGKPVKYLAVRFVITERKELELATAKRAAQAEALDTITQRIQSTTKIETALQVAARELGHTLGMKQTLVTLEPSTLPGDGNDKKENA